MASAEASKLVRSIVKINFYAGVMAAVTALSTDIFTGLISFAVYLHLLASIPYLLDLKFFSEKKMIEKII